MAIFPHPDFALRTPVLPTDKLLIHNITTGVTEYTTVALLLAASETKYWSCVGIHFVSMNPATDNILKQNTGYTIALSDAIVFMASVSLPHGVVVTSVIVTGNAAA